MWTEITYTWFIDSNTCSKTCCSVVPLENHKFSLKYSQETLHILPSFSSYVSLWVQTHIYFRGLIISINFYLPGSQNLTFFTTDYQDYIKLERKLCLNPLAWLAVLLAMGRWVPDFLNNVTVMFSAVLVAYYDGLCTGLILGLHPANEKWCYFATMSLIAWAQT